MVGTANKKIIFKAPPLTDEMIRAINLISPHCKLKTDDKSRVFWEKDQNVCSWSEYETIRKHLSSIDKPKKVLEIGPGMGRSVVFFSKILNWRDVAFDLYEGSGYKTKYTAMGPRSIDSFCGTIDVLIEMLKYNGISNYSIFNARDLGWGLDKLPGPYDLIYSFYAVGFHWSLEHYIDEIMALMHDKTIAFFTVPGNFQVFDKLKKENFEILDFTTGYPERYSIKMLIINKNLAIRGQ